MQTKEHPDDLTPREREVFDLLRVGLTNEEIAARLGISLDGAKYHVSQILSKLGVATREEATAITLAEQRGRWWVMLPLTAKAAGAAVMLAAVGGLAVLAWGMLTTSDGTEADTDGPLTVADGPRIGDHWHAAYQFFACGEKQPNARFWESGVNTHGDGIIHMEPIYSFEERSGASLVRWFEYGGGLLTDSEIRIPGSSKTFRNDDPCPNGKPGELQVFVTSAGESAEQRLEGDALQQYIPHDGDRIMIRFRTEDEPVVYSDRTVIPPEEATRTVEIAVTDDGTELGARFDPARIEVAAGETVRIVVGNQGGLSHVIRVAGEDGQYGTNDDFVSVPDIMLPGEEGYVVVRLTHVGEVPFGDDTLTVVVEGVIAVLDSSEGPAAVTPRLTPPVGAGTPQVR